MTRRRYQRPVTDGDLVTIGLVFVTVALVALVLWLRTCQSAPAWGNVDDSGRFQCRLWPVDEGQEDAG